MISVSVWYCVWRGMSSLRRRYRKIAQVIRMATKPPMMRLAMKKPCQRWKVDRPCEVAPL